MKQFTVMILLILILPQLVLGQSSNETLDSSFATPTTMTDEQAKNAKEFVHGGIKDRTIQEGCAQKSLKNCQDQEGFPLESMIGKAYALIFGGIMSGGAPTLTKKTPKVEDTAAKPGKETSADYCMYLAMAYETIGGVLQQNLQKKADQSAAAAGDIQLQSLVNLKETHKARKKTATWQGALYGTVASCYGVMAFTGKIAMDWKYFAKLGGAVALTGLYLKKANKHANAAKKVQAVIDSLPKAGDCNPWTGTSCFCKEITSKALYPSEYQEVCVLNNGNAETPKVATGCAVVADQKVQIDKECKCKQTNTCYKANLAAYAPKFNLGTNFMNSANTGFDLLNNGEFDEGKLAEYATGAAAMAGGIKPKTPVATPKVNLTPEEQKIADALAPSLGANAALAAQAPSAGPTSGYNDPPMNAAAISKLSPEVKEKLAEAIHGNYKTGGFNAVEDSPDFVFPGMPGQQAPASNGTEVLTFAEQAISKADVSNVPETPIFDIISNRYRRSGWDKLQPSEKK